MAFLRTTKRSFIILNTSSTITLYQRNLGLAVDGDAARGSISGDLVQHLHGFSDVLIFICFYCTIYHYFFFFLTFRDLTQAFGEHRIWADSAAATTSQPSPFSFQSYLGGGSCHLLRFCRISLLPRRHTRFAGTSTRWRHNRVRLTQFLRFSYIITNLDRVTRA